MTRNLEDGTEVGERTLFEPIVDRYGVPTWFSSNNDPMFEKVVHCFARNDLEGLVSALREILEWAIERSTPKTIHRLLLREALRTVRDFEAHSEKKWQLALLADHVRTLVHARHYRDSGVDVEIPLPSSPVPQLEIPIASNSLFGFVFLRVRRRTLGVRNVDGRTEVLCDYGEAQRWYQV